MNKRHILPVALAILFVSLTGAAQTNTYKKARVEGVSPENNMLVLSVSGTNAAVSVKSKNLQTLVAENRRGDRVCARTLKAGGEEELLDIRLEAVTVSRIRRLGVMLACLATMLMMTALLFRRNKARLLVMGEDNRYSNSKCQTVMWFGALIMSYMATIFLRYWHGGGEFLGGVDLPQNLMLLSGMSSFTLAAAKGIVSSQEAGGKVMTMNPQKPSLLTDLLCGDDRRPDLADFQMIVVTLLAITIYTVQVFHFLGSVELRAIVTIPDVDTTILATFGFSQGAYLMKKYVSSDKPAA